MYARGAVFSITKVQSLSGQYGPCSWRIIKLFNESPGILHPFGFFPAALEMSAPSEFHSNEVNDVVNILLIAHFGLFYNIGKLRSSINKGATLILYGLLHLGVGPSLCPYLHRVTTTSTSKHAQSCCNSTYGSSKIQACVLGGLFAGSLLVLDTWQTICSERRSHQRRRPKRLFRQGVSAFSPYWPDHISYAQFDVSSSLTKQHHIH